MVQAGVEACDDGNQTPTDSCLNNCVAARCGDGVVRDGVEACDDGNNNNGDGCEADCTRIERVASINFNSGWDGTSYASGCWNGVGRVGTDRGHSIQFTSDWAQLRLPNSFRPNSSGDFEVRFRLKQTRSAGFYIAFSPDWRGWRTGRCGNPGSGYQAFSLSAGQRPLGRWHEVVVRFTASNRRVSVTANGATVHHTARFTGLQYVRFGSNVACCGAANTSLLDDVEWYR